MKFVVIISIASVLATAYAAEPKPGSLADGPLGLPGPGNTRVKEVIKEVGKEVVKEMLAYIVDEAVAFIKKELEDSRREINVVNELDKDVWIRCRDKHINIGDRLVPPEKSYNFFFDRSFWGVTHFWCNVWYNGEARSPTHFPAYNEGAPAGNNVFVLKADGVYMKQGESMSLFRQRNNDP